VFIIAPDQVLYGGGTAIGMQLSIATSEGFADNIDVTPLS
jgi:hypothetical protein